MSDTKHLFARGDEPVYPFLREDLLQTLYKRQRRIRRRGQRPKALRQITGAAQIACAIVGQIHLMTRSHDLPRPIQGHRRAGAENEEF